MSDKNEYGTVETLFNGVLWLARDKYITSQYLGAGKTEKEALEDMEKTIKQLNLKQNPKRETMWK
jgi:hypothetical protein